jgi:hypothetical protein
MILEQDYSALPREYISSSKSVAAKRADFVPHSQMHLDMLVNFMGKIPTMPYGVDMPVQISLPVKSLPASIAIVAWNSNSNPRGSMIPTACNVAAFVA